MQRVEVHPAIAAELTRKRQVEFKIKRAFDVLVAATLLLLLSPFFVLMAVIIRLDSRGPALFRQVRLGRGGAEFEMLKFRSMRVDADIEMHREAVARLARGEPTAVVNGKPVFKAAADPRVTRVGRFIRATNLDELPQLWNVLRGQMSLVGPRPAIPYELEVYDERHYRRFSVPQGITGLWQIKRDSTRSFADVLDLDLEYIDEFSLALDFKILIYTIPRLIPRRWSF
jgi:lipopolysaccharide/colanic/teichoic acid biosynthesis glycosyltransferase